MKLKSRKEHLFEQAEEMKKKFPKHAGAIDKLVLDMLENPPETRRVGDSIFFDPSCPSTPVYLKCKDLG